MKLKVIPEDFQVEELPALAPAAAGDFGFYKLSKRSLGTPEAIRELCQAWRLNPRAVSYGGLKDRHAVTVQYLSIAGGPKQNLSGRNWKLEHLGQVSERFTSQHFRGNRFTIVLRDLSKPAVSRIKVQLDQVAQVGVANYFDEQRLRSVGRDGQHIARKLIAGDFEGAVKQALAEPYAHDRPAEKAAKQSLLRSWGEWQLLAATLRVGPAQRVVRYLADQPGDFKGAFTRLPHELQSLYLSAYQSDLWNRILARYILQHTTPKERTQVKWAHGTLPMPRKLPAESLVKWRELELPLPSARLQLEDTDPLRPLYEEVLAADGLTLATMKLPDLREPFFSKGSRRALFFPEELTHQKGRDEKYEGKWKLTLAFTLARGCYATMLMKRAAQIAET